METKKIALILAFFLIGGYSYAQDDIKIGATTFTAPNKYLYSWRNLQKENDALKVDNQILETDRNTCINDKVAIINANTETVNKLNTKVKNRGKVILATVGIIAVETAILVIKLKR